MIERWNRRRVIRNLGCAGLGTAAGCIGVNAVAPLICPERTVFDRNQSFWSQQLPPVNPPLASDLDVDVAIIGGGFTGLSTAYYLVRAVRGVRVAVLEAARCGNGASGRNGAMVLNLKVPGEAHLTRRLYELTLDNIARLGQLSLDLGIDCDLEQQGALTVMREEEALHAAQAEFAELTRSGVPLQMWGRAQTATAIGTSAYVAAICDPGAGQLHPGKLVRLWKAAAEAGGARIYENSPVMRIEAGRTHRLTTGQGCSVRAAHLVLASNAYTSKLGHLRRAVVPIANYVGITPALDAKRLAALGWTSRVPFNDSRREVYYAGCTREGRVHFGGGPVDYQFNNGMRPPGDAAARFRKLHREFARVFPALADVPFETTWYGFVDVSLDEQPAVGRLGSFDNIHYGLGYSGEGVNLTSVFGRIIADLVAGRAAAWKWFPFLDRLPPYLPNEPFRWLAVEADLAWTRWSEG
jgi:glycine/D-amino acid oxidase-like deaminating enzyme